MKKILFRKLLIDYLVFFSIALLSSSVIIWVFQAVNFLDIMIEDGRDYLIYINYSILHFPKTLSKLYPFILFFSLFYVTIKYETNNELIIFWNFGVNKAEVINLIFKFSIIMTLIQIFLTSIVVPSSQDAARSFLRESKVNFFGNFIKPQKFNDTIKGVTIFSEKKDVEGSLYNIYVKKEVDDNEFQITYAKKGIFRNINKTPYLVLIDGETITGNNNDVTNLSFSKSQFPLYNSETNATTYKKTQEVSTLDLFICMNKIFKTKNIKNNFVYDEIENCSVRNLTSIFKEFYKRIIIPFYIPLLMLIPFLLILSSKESLEYKKLKYTSFIIGLGFIIFSETTIRMISTKLIENLLIVSVPIIGLIFLYLFLIKQFSFKISTK
tara:strand:- start:1393 stop:2535 length:1143 start_codon:yes stop_codon:yes gene_type:complete